MQHPRLDGLFTTLLLTLGLALFGCDRGAPVEEAPADVAPAAETASDEGQAEEDEVAAAGWGCELYDRVREEGTDDFDGTITDEAEAYVAQTVRASLAERGVEPTEEDLDYLNRIRVELADVCAADSTTVLSEAAARIAASWVPGDG